MWKESNDRALNPSGWGEEGKEGRKGKEERKREHGGSEGGHSIQSKEQQRIRGNKKKKGGGMVDIRVFKQYGTILRLKVIQGIVTMVSYMLYWYI